MGKKSIMRMLLTLSISQICYIFIVIVIFGAGTLFLTETGIILSPQVISESVENITGKAVNGVLEAKDIPAYIEYAQLSNDGNYITGTIQDKELIEEVYKEGQVTHLQFMNGTKYECVNGLSEKWILGYKSGTSQFSNDFLRNVFPSADLTVVLSFFVTVVIGFFIILKKQIDLDRAYVGPTKRKPKRSKLDIVGAPPHLIVGGPCDTVGEMT